MLCLAIFQDDLRGVRGALPGLLLDAGDDVAGRRGRHDEGADAALARAPVGDGNTTVMSAFLPEVMNCLTPFST